MGNAAGPNESRGVSDELSPWKVAREAIDKPKKEVSDFWRTRRAILRGDRLSAMSAEELTLGNFMNALKFNLAQSSLAALPALALKKILDFYFPVVSSAGIEGTVNAVASWLWPILVPFATTMLARVVVWGSLSKRDVTYEKRALAKKQYLYLDGAYGILPQSLIAISVVLACVGVEKTPLEVFLAQIPQRETLSDSRIALIYRFGVAMFTVGFFWEGINKRWLLSRKLMAFNGYSSKMKWFWMIRDKGRNFGPWNKFLFALLYVVPVVTVLLGMFFFALSWLIGWGIFVLHPGHVTS